MVMQIAHHTRYASTCGWRGGRYTSKRGIVRFQFFLGGTEFYRTPIQVYDKLRTTTNAYN